MKTAEELSEILRIEMKSQTRLRSLYRGEKQRAEKLEEENRRLRQEMTAWKMQAEALRKGRMKK